MDKTIMRKLRVDTMNLAEDTLRQTMEAGENQSNPAVLGELGDHARETTRER